ncbi:hypothetical protein BC332_07587 [Capsicum chinense]|nr:hypothetical protein BC332_07587 [Capsicum chinense]
MSVTVFKILNVLLHEFGNNSIYTIAFAEQSAKDDTGSDTEDDDIDIHGKSQQVEEHNDDSDLLEEDYQIEVNFVEEARIENFFLQNFISPTSIRSATSANDISSPTKKGKKVNTLLPLDEPLDASTTNKVLDNVLGKGKHINAMPSKGLDDLQGIVFISNLPFDVDYGACYRRPRGSGQKVTNIQDKDSSGPVGIPSLPPVHKNPEVQVKSTTSGSSREKSVDDEVEREAKMTQGIDPTDVKRVGSRDFTMTYSLLSQLVSGRNDFMIRVRLCRMWDIINHGKMVSADVSLGNLKDPEDKLDVTDGGGAECIIYRTVMGRNRAIFPFTLRDVVEFFTHFKMHLRQEFPPLFGRDHMAYRSSYLPVKHQSGISVGPTIRARLQTGFLAAATINLSGAYTETFGPDHRPIVEFSLHNIHTMKLHQKIQQQYFNTNKEDLLKNNNTNEWDTHNKQLRKCNTTGDALSVAGNTNEAKNKRVRGINDGDQLKNRGVKVSISTKVDEQKNKKGEVSFFTTYASKVYVNLDIDYIRSLKQKFSTISTSVNVIESSNINSIPIEEEMFINRMNIKNLLKSDWSADIQNLIEDESEPKDRVPKELSTEKVSVDILLDKLEDHEEEVHIIDGG